MVYERENSYANEQTLKDAIAECWEEMGQDREYFKTLVSGYKKRLREVLLNNGYNTHY